MALVGDRHAEESACFAGQVAEFAGQRERAAGIFSSLDLAVCLPAAAWQ